MSKPKFLLDENISSSVAFRLREDGHDVVSILEETAGINDQEVLDRATKEGRILITLDQDFGKMVFRDSGKHVGVLFLRLEKESPENISQVLFDVLKRYGSKLSNKFVVASETRVRLR